MLVVSLALGVRIQVLKAALLAQMLAILLDLVAGVILERNLATISRHMGLLVALPLVNSELGGIGGILASKYSTNLNLGSLEPSLAPRKGHVRYLAIAVLIGVLLFSVLSVLTDAVGGVSLGAALLLASLGTAISAVAWLLTHSVTVFSYLHGLDPDLLSPPTITGMMDVLGTLTILFVSLSF
jgi:cation transporter-like permease